MAVSVNSRLGVAVGPRSETEFEVQFLAHYDGVYRLLYRIVGTREEAEDLAQETFVRLHDRPPDTGGGASLRAWLYRVATNLAYNHVRGRSRREHRDGRAASRGVAAGDAPRDPEASVVSRSDVDEVRRVLSTLPDRQSKLLLLRHAGLSYVELAEATGVAKGSVGTLLARSEAAFEQAFRAQAGNRESGDLP